MSSSSVLSKAPIVPGPDGVGQQRSLAAATYTQLLTNWARAVPSTVKCSRESQASCCGNGKVDGNEECDLGLSLNGKGDPWDIPCNEKCQLRPWCGDGIQGPSNIGHDCETCDDGQKTFDTATLTLLTP
eukprot:tig00000842_g4854.t1